MQARMESELHQQDQQQQEELAALLAAQGGPPGGWDTLPPLVLDRVFNLLDPKSLAAAASVCSTWRYEVSVPALFAARTVDRKLSAGELLRGRRCQPEQLAGAELCCPASDWGC